MSDNLLKDIQKYYEENSYVVIRKVFDKNMMDLLYSYTVKKINKNFYKLENDPKLYNTTYDMTFGEEDCGFNSLNFYADAFTETLLESLKPMIESYVNKELVSTYSFMRMYQKNDTLPYHNDRKSCEISSTLCVGYDTRNIDINKLPNYNWPLWLETKSKEKVSVQLEPGDLLIYNGIDLYHWREKYEGNNHLQVFFHYNRKDKKDNNEFDGRKALGLPKPAK